MLKYVTEYKKAHNNNKNRGWSTRFIVLKAITGIMQTIDNKKICAILTHSIIALKGLPITSATFLSTIMRKENETRTSAETVPNTPNRVVNIYKNAIAIGILKKASFI